MVCPFSQHHKNMVIRLPHFLLRCTNVAESSSCAGCENTPECILIPESECQPGYWPNEDNIIDGDWIVSRSTHYGGTSGGACGYGNIPNCYVLNGTIDPNRNIKDNECSGVPLGM